jgi:MinD-like ATPase involved in chromosome partitioning or flagellar assembly
MASPINRIITFYSYKGGVGRSMAMANIALVLAQWKYKVLVIDWDLEAPGLENYYKDFLNPKEVAAKPGLIDLLTLKITNPDIIVEEINWKEHLTQMNVHNISNLHLLTAGKRDDGYIDNVQKFNFTSFYKDFDGGQYLEDLREFWLDNYDFVLIDSRTGLTDSSGICSIHMPDILVLLFTANEQSFNGVKTVSAKAIEGQKQILYDRFRLRTIPIPARIENAETALLDEWLQKISSESDAMLEWLPRNVEGNHEYLITPSQFINQVKIPYKALYAYGERLAVHERGTSDPIDIGYVYETIAALLANDLQNSHLLINSRDVLIKKAKGEEISDNSDLLRKIEEEKNANNAKIAEIVTEKQEAVKEILETQRVKRKRNITVLTTGLAIIFVSLVLYFNFMETKKETYYQDFKNALSTIQGKSFDSAKSLACDLSKTEDKYNDSRISVLIDSLQKVCAIIKETQNIIKESSNEIRKLDELVTQVPEKTKQNGEKIDKIENSLSLAKNNIGATTDPGKKLQLRQDSIQLEIKRQEIIQSDTLLSKIQKPSIDLENAIQKQESLGINKDNTSVAKLTDTDAWFKEGYFLQFEDIRISLKVLDKKTESITVEICNTTTDLYCRPLVKEKTISKGESFTFSKGKYKYVLTLNRIGAAGRNPFTKAAYISFEVIM